MSPRSWMALVAIGLVVAGAGALAAWSATGTGDSGAFRVTVVGPEGALFDDVVWVEEATAFTALAATGLPLETYEYPGMGTYVVAIGDHRAAGASGWLFKVQSSGEDAWVLGDRSSAHVPLGAGDALRWEWSAG